jgi:Mg-chelatase subunit ChlD
MSRAGFLTEAILALCVLFHCLAPAAAVYRPYHHNAIRQQATLPCIPDSLLGRVGSGNGGRKIALVIDASGSMSTNDPDDIRLNASIALNDALISQSEAIDGKSSDLVTVVDFSSDAQVLYPLGDPSGAGIVIGSITLGGGTNIYTGIEAAIAELTKPGNDPTANRTGIVVLTDGRDDSAARTIEEARRAVGLGIRLSYGFLSIATEYQDTEILRAVLESGGIYATIDRPSAQQTFVAAALANGLTGIDSLNATNGSAILIPGLATAGTLSQVGSNAFTYAALPGETFNVTITALDPVALSVTLRDVATQADLATNVTDRKGVAFLEYTAPTGSADSVDIEILVAATNSTNGGIFSVDLKSSIPISEDCDIPTSDNSSTVGPEVYTGGATAASAGKIELGVIVSVLCVVIAGVWL